MHRPEAADVGDRLRRALGREHVSLLHVVCRRRHVSHVLPRCSTSTRRPEDQAHPEVTCYAESRDGIHWEKPQAWACSSSTARRKTISSGLATARTTSRPSRTPTPTACPNARYKALGCAAAQGWAGLARLQVARRHPLVAGARSAGDHRRRFRLAESGLLASRAEAVSGLSPQVSRGRARHHDRHIDRLLNWTDPVYLDYGDAPQEHLYTNAIQPYFRASRTCSSAFPRASSRSTSRSSRS